ncbi:MAG: iron ABC transporter permease [Phycisphaerales bacterium]|nr:iron ABC transporter permease [Phycisphaerales bacterium]
MSRRGMMVLVGLGALLALAAVVRLLVGPSAGGTLLALPATGEVWSIRLTRVALGVIVGGSLGVAGAMLQSLLRNPIASPDLLGMASGAALALLVVAFASTIGIAGSVALRTPAAVAGSMAVLAVVYALGQRRGLIEPVSLILVGVIISIVAASIGQLLVQLMGERGFIAGRLLLGTLRDDATRTEMGVAGAMLAIGALLGAAWGPAMDAASMGEDEARSVGVRLKRLRAGLLLASGALTAGAVVLAGPIGFVGLIAPHGVRLIAGPGNRVVVLGAGLAGAALIVAGDALVMALPLSTGRVPLSIVTAIIGGPVFIAMLRREMRRGVRL